MSAHFAAGLLGIVFESELQGRTSRMHAAAIPCGGAIRSYNAAVGLQKVTCVLARTLATVLYRMSVHLRHSMASSAELMPMAEGPNSQRKIAGADTQRLPIR